MPDSVRLSEVIAVLDGWFPPTTAASWDSVGLTCGDPNAPIARVLLAVDCVPATVAEAVNTQSQLLLTHHPLLLSGIHSVAADTPKGAVIHRLISAGVAHFAAHTNADIAEHGVSDALAVRLGVHGAVPLAVESHSSLDHLSVYIPVASTDAVIAAIVEAGAGSLGAYDSCTFTVEGVGTFRPLAGATPTIGTVGEVSRVAEHRVSVTFARTRRRAVIDAMRTAHPYEEVAFELTEQAAVGGCTGTGRIGQLATPMTLREFADIVASRLPATHGGIRVAGDTDRLVSTVAVCGGAGGSYANLARSRGADVYVTSDLKHHVVSEAVDEWPGNTMALIDTAHWASEGPWLHVLSGTLKDHFGSALDVGISGVVTDPWTLQVSSSPPVPVNVIAAPSNEST